MCDVFDPNCFWAANPRTLVPRPTEEVQRPPEQHQEPAVSAEHRAEELQPQASQEKLRKRRANGLKQAQKYADAVKAGEKSALEKREKKRLSDLQKNESKRAKKAGVQKDDS